MFSVEDTILSDDIATAQFACDLPKCKGACCVVGDAGAPVAEEEVPKLEAAYRLLKDNLHLQARERVKALGVVQESRDGLELSCCVNEECIFVSYNEDGVAYCAIQKAYMDGKLEWENR